MNNILSEIQKIRDTELKSALTSVYTSLQNEKDVYNSYFSKLSNYEIAKYFGILIERFYMIQKWDKKPQSQRDTQYLEQLTILNFLFLDQFSKNNVSANYDINDTEIIRSMFNIIINVHTLKSCCDFYLYDKFKVDVKGKQITFELSSEQEKKWLSCKTTQNKLYTANTYMKAIADYILFDKKFAIFTYSKSPKDIFDDIEKFEEKCSFVEKLPSYHKSYFLIEIVFEHYRSDYMAELYKFQNLFLSHKFDLISENDNFIDIKIKDETKKANINNILAISVFLKCISKARDKEMIESFKKEGKREDDPMLAHPIYQELNLKALINRNNPQELEKIRKELEKNMPQIIQDVERESTYISLIDDNQFIIEFEQEDFTNIIKCLFDFISDEDIRLFLEIFKYDITIEKPHFNFQSLLIFDNKIIIYPHCWAYVGTAEKLYECLLDKEMINLHNLQTEMCENRYNSLFQKNDFLTISNFKNQESKVLRNPNNDHYNTNKVSDLDTFAGQKDNYSVHFELKMGSIKNDANNQNNFFGAFEGKSKDQLPKIRKYMCDFPHEITKKVGNLDFSFEESKSVSFLISNSFLFDGFEFNGFFKTNLFSLYVLLFDELEEEILFTQNKKEYLEIWLQRIQAQKNCPLVPKHCIDFLSGSELSEKDIMLVDNFVKAHKKPFWKNPKQKTIQELIENIKNDVVFGYMKINNIEKREINLGEYKIFVPDLSSAI
ncbi:MAG: hypothetical protein EAZ85_07950 [Bacteroidetes bacterium]|nr:MAG: hypothetical protein EAZ85_07950 [Bacteroidota bacterium]